MEVDEYLSLGIWIWEVDPMDYLDTSEPANQVLWPWKRHLPSLVSKRLIPLDYVPEWETVQIWNSKHYVKWVLWLSTSKFIVVLFLYVNDTTTKMQ